eukprot:3837270-Amphidinium_carterae.1
MKFESHIYPTHFGVQKDRSSKRPISQGYSSLDEVACTHAGKASNQDLSEGVAFVRHTSTLVWSHSVASVVAQ